MMETTAAHPLPESRKSSEERPLSAAQSPAVPAERGEEEGCRPAALLAAVSALGRSMAQKFDPGSFLEPFSAAILPLVPHDLLFIGVANRDGQTFSVLAEHDPLSRVRLEDHYTPTFAPRERFLIAEWVGRSVFTGETMRIDDFQHDPRFAGEALSVRKVREAGFRSGLAVPLESGGRIIGALCAADLRPGIYTEAHLVRARQLADLIGPFTKNVIRLQRQRRRRLRLEALERLPRVLCGELDLHTAFDRLVEEVRPVLDFDVMGVELFSPSGGQVEKLAEVGLSTSKELFSIPLEQCSACSPVEAGEAVLINDVPKELPCDCSGNRRFLEAGIRSLLIVPLQCCELVSGALYLGKRKANWYDRFDEEIAHGVAAYITLEIQHQRLAEEQKHVAEVEGRTRRLRQSLEALREAMEERYGFDQIIGRSPSLQESFSLARKVAPTDTTVLITGESGTGKELAARAVHAASLRAEGPFVAVSCAALPETLLESELFGHERGAFTGADRRRTGRFELAAGGTLFLDEVGELPLPTQVKLLRFLQTREFERLGGTVTLQADVRVIAATNRDLERAVESGRFREDLYYRLNVFRVHLPPLRDRGNDVLLLADHFVRVLGARMGKGETGISRDARALLLHYPWPGNIRELQNAVERGLIVCEGGLLTASHLGIRAEGDLFAAPVPPARGTEERSSLSGGALEVVEKRLLLEALQKTRGNKSKAAELLGLSRSQLYTRLKRHGLAAGIAVEF